MQKEGRKFRRMNSEKTGIDEEAPLFNDGNESGNVKQQEAELVDMEMEKK
jgi:hypothetical protein